MGKVINASDGNQGVYMDNGSLEKVAVQIVADGTFDGTTSTVTLQESCDDVNWHDVEDSAGAAVTITVTTAASFMLKSGIVYAPNVRVRFSVGDSTTGTLTITNNYKA